MTYAWSWFKQTNYQTNLYGMEIYLTMNTDFEPIIHGWIQYEETSLKINLRFIYNHKIQTWVKSDWITKSMMISPNWNTLIGWFPNSIISIGSWIAVALCNHSTIKQEQTFQSHLNTQTIWYTYTPERIANDHSHSRLGCDLHWVRCTCVYHNQESLSRKEAKSNMNPLTSSQAMERRSCGLWALHWYLYLLTTTRR